VRATALRASKALAVKAGPSADFGTAAQSGRLTEAVSLMGRWWLPQPAARSVQPVVATEWHMLVGSQVRASSG
jgi:hypothetical protein